jgi:hypothetical protein
MSKSLVSNLPWEPRLRIKLLRGLERDAHHLRNTVLLGDEGVCCVAPKDARFQINIPFEINTICGYFQVVRLCCRISHACEEGCWEVGDILGMPYLKAIGVDFKQRQTQGVNCLWSAMLQHWLEGPCKLIQFRHQGQDANGSFMYETVRL